MTSHVKGLHVRTKFLPVPDNRTLVLVHPDCSACDRCGPSLPLPPLHHWEPLRTRNFQLQVNFLKF